MTHVWEAPASGRTRKKSSRDAEVGTSCSGNLTWFRVLPITLDIPL